MKKMVWVAFAVVFLLSGCGKAGEIPENAIFDVEKEGLLDSGYEEIADFAYLKLEGGKENPVANIVYYRNNPENALYLISSIMREAGSECEFIVEWNDKEYVYDDSLPEDIDTNEMLDYFPEEWQDVIKNIQAGFSIDNFISKSFAEIIDGDVSDIYAKFENEEDEYKRLAIIDDTEEPISIHTVGNYLK